ncbi:zinc finger protein 845-like isoform X2 [Aricia agestis]|uniref:zinc finger protein 845-like isoform X2 n=1 Tax=Aricia agestis TaxID=91739 RepID=UPI001C204AAE|nr:zinc finger protein 845-like isoform X2 [Aricia agestis]
MQCRACLKTNCKNATKLDEFNVKSFNLITNLNIHSGDGMPQQLCAKCTKDLKVCIAFREKCISSNSVLSQVVFHKKLKPDEIKEEDLESNIDAQNVLKTEILIVKTEESSKVEFLKEESLSSEDQFDDSFQTYVGLCLEYLDEDSLFEHVSSHEQSNYCQICSKHFASWPKLLVHRAEHLTGQTFACHICLKRFRLTLSLQNHYNVKHLNNTLNLLQCSDCDKVYDSVKKLQKHIWAYHGSKTFKCDKCSLEFPHKQLYNYHRQRKHAERTMLYCDQCDYKNVFSRNLKLHALRMHTAGRVSCASCGAALADGAALARHRCTPRPHNVCPVCGKILTRNSRLANHLKTHTEERSYKCDRCPAAYKTRAALRVHAARHDGIRRYTCDTCPQAFHNQSSLIRHRRLHTGEKRFVCTICAKAFTEGYNLKVHMRVHNKHFKKNPETERSGGIQD